MEDIFILQFHNTLYNLCYQALAWSKKLITVLCFGSLIMQFNISSVMKSLWQSD